MESLDAPLYEKRFAATTTKWGAFSDPCLIVRHQIFRLGAKSSAKPLSIQENQLTLSL